MLVLGDAHADDPANRRALFAAYRAADEAVALQVGDLLAYDLPTPTWFVAGNNEDFDVIDALRRGDRTLGAFETRGTRDDADGRPTLLAGDADELEGVRVAGLSGNYAPTQFDRPRSDLTGERRRHFVREDVDRALALGDADVFLAHEAPHGLLRRAGRDVGCERIDRILRELDPDLCLVGHHHEHVEGTFGGTRVVSLAPVWESYYLLDPETLALDQRPTPETDADADGSADPDPGGA